MTMERRTVLIYLLYYAISFILMPFILVQLLLFYVYKKLVFAIIYMKNNPTDIKMLNSEDIIWTLGELHLNNSDVVAIFNVPSENIRDSIEQAKEKFVRRILRYPEKYPKMTCAREKFMGYTYLKKINFNIDDFVTIVKVENNQSLSDSLAFQVNKELPLKNTFLWEVIIFVGGSDWKKKEKLENTQFPILFRINHIMGDGLSMMNLLIRAFGINGTEISLKSYSKKLPNRNQGYSVVQYFENTKDAWNSPNLRRKRRVAYAVESDVDTVENIKSMKKELGDTTFTDIILVAISASVENYFKKASMEVPRNILMAIVGVNTISNLNRSDGTPDLKNNVSFAYLKLPIRGHSQSLVDRLRVIQKETMQLRRSPELKIHHFLFSNIVGLLPEQILRKAVILKKLTATLSNLPELQKISCRNGNEIQKIFFFTPLRDTLGMGFSVLTYSSRLHVGLNFDEATIPFPGKGQEIVNGILHNLALMKNEIFKEKNV